MLERSSKKRPRDLNQLAKSITDEATGEAPMVDQNPQSEKNPHAQALGRLGGKKGGLARAAGMTAEERKEIARKAAVSRWSKRDAP